MRKLILLLCIFAILLASSEASLACSCTMPTVAQAVERSKAVFLGEVVATDFDGVIFKVKRSWKGADAPEIKVYVRGIGTSCDPGVVKGETLLVYAYGSGVKSPLRASYCFRARVLEQADEDIKELDRLISRQSHTKPGNPLNRTRNQLVF